MYINVIAVHVPIHVRTSIHSLEQCISLSHFTMPLETLRLISSPGFQPGDLDVVLT